MNIFQVCVAESSFEIVDLHILIFESVDGSALGCFRLSEITLGEVENKINLFWSKNILRYFLKEQEN